MMPDALDAQEFIAWKVDCIIAANLGRPPPSWQRRGTAPSSATHEPPRISEAAALLQRELEKYLPRIVEAVGHARS